MDKKQLDEFTMHMVAGTDPLTALAASVPDDDSPRVSILHFKSAWLGMAIGAALFFLWLLLK